jgi:hypothetical protein
MGNDWWGTPDPGDDDGWQQNWNNRGKVQGSKEHRGSVEGPKDDSDDKQGYRENKQGPEEDSLSGESRICLSWGNCDYAEGTENKCETIGFCLKRPVKR